MFKKVYNQTRCRLPSNRIDGVQFTKYAIGSAHTHLSRFNLQDRLVRGKIGE